MSTDPKLIDSYVFRSPQYEPVIPDSKGEVILYVVCTALYGEEESWISKAPTQLKVGAFVETVKSLWGEPVNNFV